VLYNNREFLPGLVGRISERRKAGYQRLA
jgi:hypothetical protein